MLLVLRAVHNCTDLTFYGSSESSLKSICRAILHDSARYLDGVLYDDSGRPVSHMRKTDFDWK